MSLFHAAKDATRRRTSTAAAVVLAVVAGSARVVGAAYPGHCGQFFLLPAPDDQPSTGGSNGSGGKRSKSAKPTGGSSSGGGGGGDTSCDVYFDLLMKGYRFFVEDAAGEDGMMTEDEFVMWPLISQFGEVAFWAYSDILDSDGDGYVVLDEVPKPAAEVVASMGLLTQEELKSKQNMLETLWTVFTVYLNAKVFGTCDLDGDTVMDLNNEVEIDCFKEYFPIMLFRWFDTDNDGYISLSEVNLALFKTLMNCKTYLSETSDCGTVAE